ncbi:ribosome maturation factor RimP [Balneicella halophila]|uniref:Ribosome maturation factor RimP n=1 Tax=Balneicella halophila TaxID=1537566 RepID=A0A7L4URI9_BALHA|nr:ribosome assembly cofactor RimP [Balneicella halophila]PVX52122.1 ribosome maturation factor RimP [Balneicella halophila]
MIAKEKIEELLSSYLTDKQDVFLVEVKTTPDNRIKVFLDSLTSLSIEECMNTSRWLESQLDREVEDFELQVSSAGIGNPFKVEKQYQKAIGKQVEVAVKDGRKLHGKLTAYGDNTLTLEVAKKVVVKGKKKKQEVQELEEIPTSEINTTKEVITF